MKMRTGPTTADLLKSMGVQPSTPSAPVEGPDLLAALHEVLDALPNSRAELDAIIQQARQLLSEMDERLAASESELSGFVARQLDRSTSELKQVADQGLSKLETSASAVGERVDGISVQIAEIADEVDGVSLQMAETVGQVQQHETLLRERIAELDLLLSTRLAGDWTDKAAFDALNGLVQSRLEEITAEFNRVEDELGRAVADLKKHIDWRVQGVRSAAPTPTKIYQDGVLVGERRGLNFAAGANVTLDVADNGSERVTVTISASGGGGGGGFTQEEIEDFVGALIQDSSDLDWTYDDATPSLTAVIKAGSVTDAMLAGSIALSKLATDPLARANHTGTQTASTISDFSEAVDDRVASLLVAGTNVTLTYDDPGGSLTIDAAGGAGATNLGYTASPTDGTVTSDTGTDATVSLADDTNAGLMAPAEHTKLAGIETGATADQTATEILTAIKTVDGTGSGLDADLLDGHDSAYFAVDADVVHDTGDETIAGIKTFSSAPVVPADAYAVGWNGKQEPAPKDAVYDKVEALDAAKIDKTTLDANSVLYATADDTPAALAMGASTILARLAAGNIVAATPSQLRTLLTLVVGTDVQAWDTDLDWVAANLTAAGKALLDDADAAAQRTTLGLGTAATQASSAFQAADSELTAIAGLTSAADRLPYFTGAGTAALATFTAAGRALVDDADAAAQRTTLGLGTAATAASTDFQAADTELSALAGLTSAADRLPYFTGAGTAALATFTAAGRALVDDADAAAQRTTLGLGTAATAASTDFQAADTELAAIAGLTSAADRLPYFTGAGTAALATFTTAGRALVDDADATAQRTTLGLGTAAVAATTDFEAAGTVNALAWKNQVRLATAASLAAYTRTTNVLQANANGALANIDGVAPAAGDRILLLNGAAGADNGIYTIDSLGSAGAKWQMTRAADADSSADLANGLVVKVSEGTANADAIYELTTNATITLNTTSLSFALIAADKVPLSLLTTQGDLPYATAASTWARLAKGTAFQSLRMNSGATAPAWGGAIGAKAHHSTTQSITTSGTYQAVIFDTEDFDTDSIHSTASNTSRFVVPTGMGGKWLLQAELDWPTSSSTGARSGSFKTNGTTFILNSDIGVPASTTASSQYLNWSAVVSLSAADYVELMAYQTSGGALNLNGSNTGMTVIYLGP